MGTYLNPGKDSFKMAVNSEIFVDKSEMICYLNTVINTHQRYISVSRPRRFGKTMAVDMICEYYDRKADSGTLFSQRKLAEAGPVQVGGRELKWDACLGKFDVIRIVMTDFIKPDVEVELSLHKMQRRILDELCELYPDVSYDDDDFIYSMSRFFGSSRHQFVVVIDEWDAIFRVKKDDDAGQTKYLNFLRDWLKDKNYIALAYMTGILPIKKYGEHSALNMFDEYSMMQPMDLAAYTGFTVEEVRILCEEYEMDYRDISDWYDGYVISDAIPVNKRRMYRKGQYEEHRFPIYSPLSVVKALRTGYIKNYWNKTETYEALAEYIRMDYDGLKDAVALLMDGGRIQINTKTYQNDMTTFHGKDDILALLVHLGYLGFDDDCSEVFIPNKEILDEFKNSTQGREWTDTFKSFEI